MVSLLECKLLDAREESGRKQESRETSSYLSSDFYKQFFDIDTEQVISRIKSSFWPVKNQFLSQIKNKGDLYGNEETSLRSVVCILFMVS